MPGVRRTGLFDREGMIQVSGRLELTVGLALIPVFNVSQLIKEIIIGEYSPVNFATAFASNVLYALVAFWISVRIFKTESVLFRS
jgi:ABC-type Na+ efflux pump permease subunit